jgi:DNA mismatch repair protein MutL
LISDQKPLLKTSLLPPDHTFSEQLASRIESVLGKQFLASSYPVSFHKEPYFLEGYVGLPSYTRPNRTGQYLFINQRAVQSPLIGYAVKTGYGPMLAPNRHPVYVLHLKMPGSLVDINVHPQKKEVRLRQEHHLKEAVIQAVQTTLQKEGFSDSYAFDMLEKESAFEEPKVEYKTDSFTFKEEISIPATWSPLIKQRPLTQDLEKPQELPLQAPIKKSQAPRVVTTLANFILVDPSSFNKGQVLCLIDQKAAHARIHYERLLKKFVENGSEKNYIQPLLIPQHWEFSSLEAALVREYGESLAKMGFGIRDMGQNTFLIDAVPDVFDKVDAKEVITNILQGIYEEQDTKQFQREKEKSLLIAACKASTRAVNQQMSREEAQLVIDQLFNCETPFICPSGNPTWVCLTSEDLLNLFQKKLI